MEKCSSEKGMDSIEAYTEEPLQEEGLFSAVRSILDRLAPDQTFQTLTHQITDLDIDTVEKSEGTIDLIFEKAINEAAFSGACAYMCRCLIRKSEAAEKNGVKGENMPFLKIVLNKCQKEFEKEESVEKRIHERLEELPSKGLSEEELQMKKNDLQDEAAILKRRTLGNIQFIGELFKLKILTENIVHDCIVKLLKRNDEEAFECLCKLLVSIGKYLDHAKAKPRVDQYFNQIKKIITARLTSARVRYMMQDIVDLRSNDWVPRREDNNPKTIDQIHTEEAADLAKKTQMMIQEADENKKLRAKDMKKGASEKGIDAMADYKLRRTRNRWVRSSLTVKVGTEEEQKTEELFRKVRSILNKLTPEKFQTLTQQMIDLEMDTEERFEGAIDLIFEKAIYEPQFSVPYANMCRCLIPKKVFVEQDGVTKEITFRKILLNKLQREFEKEKSVEKRIHERLEGLSSKGLSEEELQIKKYDLQEEAALIKQRSLGNSRFIGELFKLKMLSENIMHDCVVKLLKSNDEEAFECLCTLLVTVGKTLDHRKAKRRVDQYFNQINKIITARITSARVRFLMQDVVDLRSNDWVPRREDNNPKTIDQIHKEAAKEAKFRR